MSKEIYISSTPHETRLAIVEHDALTEIYYERENEYSLAGSIYNGKVTRVLPGMQSSFVDIGLDRDAFLYITDFMEEAGDSAEFDSHGGGRAPRESGGRSEGRRSGGGREGRGERGEREEQPRLGTGSSYDGPEGPPEVREPSDAELFTKAVSGLDPARPVSNGDRGGSRRGGRGRSDRNSDGTPRRDRSQERTSGNRADSPRIDAPQSEPIRPEVTQPILGAPRSAENSGDVGEGAPGADGSRRWRGRRGRRGSRPDVPRDQGAGSTTSLGNADTPSAEPVPIYEAYEDAQVDSSADEVAEPLDARSPAEGSGAESRGGRSRSGREDRRGGDGRDDRGNRGERSGQAPRVPRGFAPSTSLYQVEGSAETTQYGGEDSSSAPAEPVILPGESLSKYRTGGSELAPAVSATANAAAPATEFVVSGWDGGMVLPGETIRPRGSRPETRSETRSEARPEARPETRPEGQSSEGGRRESSSRDASGGRGSRGEDRGGRVGRDTRGGGRGRDDRGGRGERSDRGPRPEGQPETRTDASVQAPNDQRPYRNDAVSVPITPVRFDPLPAEPATAALDTHAAAHGETYADKSTPTYLSAPDDLPPSHLVTPSEHSHADLPVNSTFVPPPPMPVAEPAPSAEPSPIIHHAAEQEYEPLEASASYRVDPIAPSEFRQAAPVAEPEPVEQLAGLSEPDAATHAHALSEAETPASEHQVTSIFATGEMHSESAELTSQELTSQDLTAVAPSAQGAQQSTEGQSAEIAAGDQSLPYFAPGTGLLEEETLEDEEYTESAPLPTLHAHAEPEQETLEGAADLGSMIQEMAIDRTTRAEQELDDEDDDDLLEEDEDFEESEFEEGEDGEQDDDDLEGTEGEPRGSEEGGDFRKTHGAEGHETARELEQAAFGSAFEGEPAGRNGDGVSSGRNAEHGVSSTQNDGREPRRDGRSGDRGRRDGRRGERDRGNSSGRSTSGDRGSRSSSSSSGSFSSAGSSGDRDRDRGRDGNRERGRGRQSMQATNLPAISDLLKPGQEVLVQIAKEPIAKKGARITSHIALPGRFLVFMPTVSHTGVSRKIESDAERRRLKEILLSEKGEASGGFIVRTAASGASEEELRSDLRFLLNLWTDIKNRSESSKSPALIYHDLNLVERVLRDQVTDTFSAIWVDTETEYERVLRFLQRFQPSLIRRVKLYTKEVPLFEQFGITEEINKALRSKVWLKSGGSIVINQTEALVAIDINTGKFVGKTARLEDTIVKTNLDAIPEIVRQIRLRDLGGIIIIDFIDMDDRKNRNRVMAALEDELKADRAPSKVLNFNDFGLVAITRKRVKQSLERTLSTTCGVCQGTGMVKSPITVCNDIYIEMRKMQKHLDRGDVMLRVHPEVVKQLKSTSSRWLQEMEEMVGKTILVKSDPSLHPEQFDLH